MVLLDTHVRLWCVHGDVRRVGRRARQLLSRAESRDAIRVTAARGIGVIERDLRLPWNVPVTVDVALLPDESVHSTAILPDRRC